MSTTALDKAKPDAVTPAVAFEKERSALLAKMTEATQEVAKDCDAKLDKANRGNTMTMYYIGARLIDALDEKKQGEFGSNAGKQIAAYVPFFDGDTNLLYDLRRFATVFPEEFVKEHAEQKIGKGQHITIEHWKQLSRIQKQDERTKTFDAMVTHGLSAAEIARRLKSGEVKGTNVRAGGRKVSIPSSPLSGLEKLRADSLKMNNYLKMCDKHVFGKIASMAVGDFNEVMMTKLQSVKEEMAELRTKLDADEKSVDACIERGTEALAKRAEKEAATAAAKAPAKQTAKPPAKPAAKKPAAKKPAAKKPVAKVKAGRPVAATATA